MRIRLVCFCFVGKINKNMDFFAMCLHLLHNMVYYTQGRSLFVYSKRRDVCDHHGAKGKIDCQNRPSALFVISVQMICTQVSNEHLCFV